MLSSLSPTAAGQGPVSQEQWERLSGLLSIAWELPTLQKKARKEGVGPSHLTEWFADYVTTKC